MHRKSQSTSALSVILSARDDPRPSNTSSDAQSHRYLPPLSESESRESAKTPSRRIETGPRISHSRTKSDLTSLSPAPRSRALAATPRRLHGGIPAVCVPSSSTENEPPTYSQPMRRRDTLSSTEEGDTSDAFDLGRGKSRKVRVTSDEVTVRRSKPSNRRSDEDVRPKTSRRTPRRGTSPPGRTPRHDLRDLTLEQCPSILLSLRTLPGDRLRALQHIEREFAQACQDIDPLESSIHDFLSRRLHIPLLATFRGEAQYLLRSRMNETASSSTVEETLKGLDVLLNVLQGICLIGLREHGEFAVQKDITQSIGSALQETWVVEALIDLLSWTQAVSSTILPTHQILNTLFTILVNLPATLPAFSAAGGYEVIAGLLKLAAKEVKVKAIEFLVYLGTATIPANGQQTGDVPRQEAGDVFGTPRAIEGLPSTPKSKHALPEARPRYTPSNFSARNSSGNSTASAATNQADRDLLRTPLASDYGSDFEVWSRDRDRTEEARVEETDDFLQKGNPEAFKFPKSQSSSALNSHGFYTPQQRSEKHHASRASTSGSSHGSQEDSATFKHVGSQSSILRRSSLSIRPSSAQQRIPSLRSLARVEEELAMTPKKLVAMSPARLKADFRESEVREGMCSTIKVRSRPSSGLRSPKTPTTGRQHRAESGSETPSAGTSPAKGLTRDSSRTSLHNASKSTDPRLLIPSGKVNIGLGFPGTRQAPITAGNTMKLQKERTGSAEYPPELAKDSRIRGLNVASREGEGQERRIMSGGSTASQHSASGGRGMRKSQTLAHLADPDSHEQSTTIRRSGG